MSQPRNRERIAAAERAGQLQVLLNVAGRTHRERARPAAQAGRSPDPSERYGDRQCAWPSEFLRRVGIHVETKRTALNPSWQPAPLHAADRRAHRDQRRRANRVSRLPDLLEPAKGALRLKQFEDAAGRLTTEPRARAVTARYPVPAYSASARIRRRRGRCSKARPREASHARPSRWPQLSPTTPTVDEAAAEALALPRQRPQVMPMQAACCRPPVAVASRRRRARNGPLRHALSMTIAVARRNDVAALDSPWPPLAGDASDEFRRSVLHHAAETGAAGSGALAGRSRRPGRCGRRAGHHPPDAVGDRRAHGRDGHPVARQGPHCRGRFARTRHVLCGTARSTRASRATGEAGSRSEVAQRWRLERRRLFGAIGSRWVTGYLVQQGAQPVRRRTAVANSRSTACGSDSSFSAGRRCLRWMAGRRTRCGAQRSNPVEGGTGTGWRPGGEHSGWPAGPTCRPSPRSSPARQMLLAAGCVAMCEG